MTSSDVDALLEQLTEEETLQLLDGDGEFWSGLSAMMAGGYNRVPYVAGEVSRLGIRGIHFADGPRGAVLGHSTCFPVAMARGATFDTDLEREIGDAIGREVRAQGGNLFAGICVNLLRHPAWGRAQETYGEEPVHVGLMGAALTRGVQQHVMGCVKHFACNSMENARFRVDVEIDDETLHDVFLPHFERIVAEGVAAVMSAYNSVNGEWCGHNATLLTEILRDTWGFEGFVMSDFIFGIRDSCAAVTSGLDLEMPFRMVHRQQLADALRDGRVSWSDIRRSAHRILSTQKRFDAIGDVNDGAYDPSLVAGPKHRALARRTAAASMVLLENRVPVRDVSRVLPLCLKPNARIAVLGRLANVANTGDRGSSNVRPPEVVTPLDGIRKAAVTRDVALEFDDASSLDRAVQLAAASDVAIVVVGYTHEDEGEYVGPTNAPELARLFPPRPSRDAATRPNEPADSDGRPGTVPMGVGGDRQSLRLHGDDEQLIASICAVNPRTVVIVECSSAVIMESWRAEAAAILLAWYPGMEGGHALADVLFGDAIPGGRLPFVIPTDEAHLPFFDRDATHISYSGLHGHWLLQSNKHTPAYPFGFGLGWGDCRILDVGVFESIGPVAGAGWRVRVVVENRCERETTEVVQMYARPSGTTLPWKLIAFRKTAVGGASHQGASHQEVFVEIEEHALRRFDPSTRQRHRRDATWDVRVGLHAGDEGVTRYGVGWSSANGL